MNTCDCDRTDWADCPLEDCPRADLIRRMQDAADKVGRELLADSFNGRTSDSDSENDGSNPSSASIEDGSFG